MSDELDEASDGEVVDMVIPRSLDGERVDRVVAIMSGLSRSEVRQIVRSGAVNFNEVIVTKDSLVVREGGHLVARLPVPRSANVVADRSVDVNVAREERTFLVINKAPGQVVHPGPGQSQGTLVAGVVARFPDVAALSTSGVCAADRPGIVHRLDKGTSGLLVVARTPEAFTSLSAQLSARTMQREYVALVQGHLVNDRGVVDAPIGRSARQPTLMTVRSDGRPARTAYDVVARLNVPDPVTLIRLRLETGRTHQIRVHLASIGHPLVNDLRYGHHRDPRLHAERFFLHSSSLGFHDPEGGEWVETRAALPDDLRVTLPPDVRP